MRELDEETTNKIEMVQGESGENCSYEQTETSSVVELNLLIVLLSLSSVSSSSLDDYEDKEMEIVKKDQKAKACISRLQRRQDEVKLGGRRTQIYTPMFKDCRHGRRM